MDKKLVGLMLASSMLLVACGGEEGTSSEDIGGDGEEQVVEEDIEEQVGKDIVEYLGYKEGEDDIVKTEEEGTIYVIVNEEEKDTDLTIQIGVLGGNEERVSISYKKEGEGSKKELEEEYKDMFEIIDRNGYKGWVDISTRIPKVDKYGKDFYERILNVTLEEETLSKINWENKGDIELEEIADNYTKQ